MTSSLADDRTGLGLDRTTQSKVMWAAVVVFIVVACVTQIPGLLSAGLASILFTTFLFAVAL